MIIFSLGCTSERFYDHLCRWSVLSDKLEVVLKMEVTNSHPHTYLGRIFHVQREKASIRSSVNHATLELATVHGLSSLFETCVESKPSGALGNAPGRKGGKKY